MPFKPTLISLCVFSVLFQKSYQLFTKYLLFKESKQLAKQWSHEGIKVSGYTIFSHNKL